MTTQQPENTDSFVHIPITRNEFEVLHNILHPYILFVRSKMPPSLERRAYLSDIEHLRKRITDLLTTRMVDGEKLHIYEKEAQIIDKALSYFANAPPSIAPQSVQRMKQ